MYTPLLRLINYICYTTIVAYWEEYVKKGIFNIIVHSGPVTI